MAHATVRATIVPEIVNLIATSKHITNQEAIDLFYGSETGKSFAEDDSGLYGQSPLYIFGLFCEEMQRKN